MFRRRSFALLLAGFGLGGAYIESTWPRPPFVAFVDVGQGDCTVIHDRGLDVVVDVGGRSENHDLGQRLALPSLRQLHLAKIDLLVLTHPDMDHVGGLKAFLRRYHVGQIAIPIRFESSEHMIPWLAECGVSPSSVLWLDGSRTLSKPGLNLTFSAPPFGDPAPDNEGSMITQVSAEGKSFLLTGDADAKTEAWVVSQGLGHVDVLKVGHHGSNSATSDLLLQTATPLESVISCGRKNPYGHPHPAVLDRLNQAQTTIWRTDRNGDITFWLDRPL